MAGASMERFPVAAMAVVALLIVALAQMHGAAAQGTDCSATRRCANPSHCCSQYNYCDTGDQWCGVGCQNGPCYGAGGGGGSEWSFFTQANFESRFPGRDAIYTYAAFRTAAATYSDFATGAGDVGKREMAAFLANTDHESGGFVYVREREPQHDYCEPNAQYPCAPGQAYYGRGPIQLSYNYNYGKCGAALSKDLLANPDQVATNGDTAFQTALWYWMTSGVHDAIIANPPSFGLTIRRINGFEECDGKKPELVASRVAKYQAFCAQFGVDPGSDLYC